MEIGILATVGILGFVALVMIVTMGFIISRMYHKSTPEAALIRTGGAGRKVVTNGGIFVIKMFHEITRVNMRTLGLEVVRRNEDALITADRLRVDVGVKFFVRVSPNADAIMAAAQTLGKKRLDDPEQLKPMVEDKLIDALRAVAATMTMDQLHENRTQFVQDVQNALAEDLKKNGLELESVSLTTMDQTPFTSLDENNAFNAVGMQKLAEVIAKSKKERAAIDADAEVKVAESARTAAVQKFLIEQETEEKRIEKDQAVAEAESRSLASRQKAAELSQQEQDAARIAREEAIQVADQNRQIAVNVKSMEESKAKAEADAARAEATKAEEAVTTARQIAAAERQKQIEVIAAQQAAEKDATRIRVAAAAKKEAALDEAAAVLTVAEANAKAKAQEASGIEAVGLAEAKAKEALVGAENNLTEEVIQMKIALARLQALPDIIAEMVRPAEMIDKITVHNVTGLGNGNGGTGNDAGSGGVAGQLTKAILDTALLTPAMKALGKEAGINLEAGLDGIAFDIEQDSFPVISEPVELVE